MKRISSLAILLLAGAAWLSAQEGGAMPEPAAGWKWANFVLLVVGLGGQILSDLGIHKIRLLTNTPTHVPALQGFGIEIVAQIPVSTETVRR